MKLQKPAVKHTKNQEKFHDGKVNDASSVAPPHETKQKV